MAFYVTDTSSLISNPSIVTDGYPGGNIVIPLTVVSELDDIKTKKQHPGSQARDVINRIDSLRQDSNRAGDGMVYHRPAGGTLRVERNHISEDNIPAGVKVETNDDRIILVAHNLGLEQPGDVVLLTQDRSMSITAEAWGVKTEYSDESGDEHDLGTGVVTMYVTDDDINSFYSEGELDHPDALDVPVNTGVIAKAPGGGSGLAVSDGLGMLVKVDTGNHPSWMTPRGANQNIANHLLMGGHFGHETTEFVGSLSGRAGAGKSFLAIASGLHRVVNTGEYRKVIVFRPTEPVGRDLGFLPGNMDEKLEPWRAAVDDVIESLGVTSVTGIDNKAIAPEEVISVESVNFVRGRTLTDTFVIVDEAQNLEPVVLRTLLTRIGRGSAAVLTWDPSQIDNPFLRSGHLGPETVLSPAMPDDSVWHVELPNPERGGVSAIFS